MRKSTCSTYLPFESRGPQPPKTSRPSGTRRPGPSGTNARDPRMAARMQRSMPAKPEVFPELWLSCEQPGQALPDTSCHCVANRT